MPGYIPAPVKPKIGWSGQAPVSVPSSGLFITPGVGLIGRTSGGALLLDNGTDVAAEPVTLFSPGAFAAKTLGKWRNRRASGNATLAVMECNLGTAPTTVDGTTNFYRVLCTDGAGTTIALPIVSSTATYVDLDRSGGAPVIDPWSGQAAGGGYHQDGIGFRRPFIPSQGFTVGAFSVRARTYVASATYTPAQVRGQLWQQDATSGAWTLLATAYATTGGTATFDLLTFHFPRTVQIVTGTRYALTWDIFQVWTSGVAGNNANNLTLTSLAVDTYTVAPNGGTPANVTPTGTADSCRVYGNVTTGLEASQQAYVRALTWDQLAAVNTGYADTYVQLLNAGYQSTGLYTIFGTTSGLAPVVGDLTFSLAVTGAPVGGADLNLRAVLLP